MKDSPNTGLTPTEENTLLSTDKPPHSPTSEQLTEKERHFIYEIEAKLALSVPPPNIMKSYQEVYPDAPQTFFLGLKRKATTVARWTNYSSQEKQMTADWG